MKNAITTPTGARLRNDQRIARGHTIIGAATTVFSIVLFGACATVSRGESAAPIKLDKLTAIAVAKTWTDQSPRHGWTYPQATGSMRPTLDERSILLLERVTARDLKAGDIACYTVTSDGSGDKTIIHRALAIAPNGYVYFSGDHNRYSDGWIAPQRICWRVAQIIQTPDRI
ncbi:MAG TPA: S24/S26 family peptidase [Opitutaceae bacterium]|nr:S24/S26 family peptidase [Opitutaceae bacterium]